MDPELRAILDLIKERKGFDFSGYDLSTLEQQIQHRVCANKHQSLSNYLNYLTNIADEVNHLFDELTINVSHFFRNTLTYETIENVILPDILRKKMKGKDRSLRIWSSACSQGEEPYSMAILLKELLSLEDIDISINLFATDINKNAINNSLKATYPFDSVAKVRYEFIKKYFDQEGEMYRLKPEIKELVQFSQYNLLEEKNYAPPESVFGNFDMILCRNVLIYFNTESQIKIFDKLYRSLAGEGYLILGEAEVPPEFYSKRFDRVNEHCHIYQKL